MGERPLQQTRDEIDRADGARVFHSDRPYNAQAAYDLVAIAVIRCDHCAAAQSGQSVFGADPDRDGPLLNHLFRQAVETGKRVRHETRISIGPTSISSVAVRSRVTREGVWADAAV